MADTAVIREFLVALGFKTDEKGLKNFTAGVAGATKQVVGLVTAIQGASLTVGAAVASLASKLEGLYFVGQRTNSTTSSLKALDFAARNLGISSQAALGTVESLARFMRENPAGENYLQSIGIATRTANGDLRDTVDILADLGQELGQRPAWLAAQYGNILGIDQNLLLAMRNGDFARFLTQYREMTRNTGLDKASEDAHQFMIQLRELGAAFDTVAIKVEGALVKKLGPQLQELKRWFDEDADDIADTVSNIGEVIVSAGSIILPVLKKVAEGWKNIFDWTKAAGRAINEALPASWGDKIGAGTNWLFEKLGIKESVDKMLGLSADATALPPKAAAKPQAAPKNAVDATAFFQKMGWTKDQAAGIVANLRHESNLNPSAVGDSGKAYGIAQWHPDRQDNFKAWAGKDIRDSSLLEQLQFVNHELTQGAERRAGELLRAAQNAKQAGEVVSRYYERPSDREGEALRRGATAVELSQQTNINIYGVTNANDAGKAVSDAQRSINADVVRNLQGAVS